MTAAPYPATTLGELLARTVERGANPRAGVLTPDGDATWAQVLAGAEGFAAALLDHGLGAGTRVAVFAENSVTGVQLIFGCACAGTVAVPVNTRLHPREIRHILQDAAVDAVIVTAAPGAPADFPALARAALQQDTVPAFAVAGRPVPGFTPLVPRDDRAAVAAARAAVRLDQVAQLIYTSGTTATARGCPLTHAALVSAGIAVGRDRFRCTATDVLWDVLPLFHLSFLLPLLAVLGAGGSFATDRRFDAPRAVAMLRDRGVTVAFTCFPTVMTALLEQPEFDAAFAGVRLMLNVGPPQTLHRIQSRAPHTVQLTSYGSTEAGGIAATTDPDDDAGTRLGTNGKPLPGMQIAAMDPSSEALLAPGEPGELVVRGTNMFEGYHNAATAGPAGGWLRTGDHGFVDDTGRVHYLGRLKDMIKVGGENVGALEIEEVLGGHPAVAAVAVVAAPDRRYTEVPAAFVELRATATADAGELTAYCAERLARFKVPRYVRFVGEWPMSATKIQKNVLVQRIVAELGPEALPPLG